MPLIDAGDHHYLSGSDGFSVEDDAVIGLTYGVLGQAQYEGERWEE